MKSKSCPLHVKKLVAHRFCHIKSSCNDYFNSDANQPYSKKQGVIRGRLNE